MWIIKFKEAYSQSEKDASGIQFSLTGSGFMSWVEHNTPNKAWGSNPSDTWLQFQWNMRIHHERKKYKAYQKLLLIRDTFSLQINYAEKIIFKSFLDFGVVVNA